MLSFNELKKLSKKQVKFNSNPIKIALLADSSTQFLNQAIMGIGIAHDVQYEIWEADYNQIDRQVLDSGSELYAFQPEFVILLRSSEHLLYTFYQADAPEHTSFASREIQYLGSLVQQISSRIKCKVITNTYFEINDAVFGNYANKISSSFIYQVRKLNLDLMDLAQLDKNLFLLDLSSLVSECGYKNSFDPKLHLTSDLVYNFEILPDIAFHLHSIVQSIQGRFNKCLIVDLDNTLWGGIIGDDGIQGIRIGDLQDGWAYTELQLWIKQLKNRGIIIAVCSKNTESIAKEPFEKHPDMELRLDDIALFVANWENKVDNIRYIQSILQIGFDSIVFLDDNPFEREMVREAIPELTIPDLPEDPSEYVRYLRNLNLFETASYTEEDAVRTKQYQKEASRAVFQKSFANEEDFLKSLNMVSEVKPFNSFTIPRVAQLTQRSNQFNLRTKRYTEPDIQRMVDSPDYYTFSFTLEDKFGDHGLIAVAILQKQDAGTLFIDTWIMSCRVLKRGMERFVLFALAQEGRKNGFSKLLGEYLPTPKNGIVKDHYLNLGFTDSEGKWLLEINEGELTNQSLITKK